jgi:hypothetical protein
MIGSMRDVLDPGANSGRAVALETDYSFARLV